MKMIFSLIMANPYINLPSNMQGWVGWGLLLLMTMLLLRVAFKTPGVMDRMNAQISLGQIFVFIELALMVIFTSLFIGVMYYPGKNLLFPGIPLEVTSITILLFASVPWLLAAGISGTMPAVVLGFISGLLLGFWETHSIFTSLEIAFIAILFCIFIRQRYRSPFYRLVRHPLGSALILLPIYLGLALYSNLFSDIYPFASAVDYAITQSWIVGFSRWVECLIGCLIVEALYLVNKSFLTGIRNKEKRVVISIWVNNENLLPSPAETSIKNRFVYKILPIFIISLILSILSGWIIARIIARRFTHDLLAERVETVTNVLLNFIKTGQGILVSISEPELFALGDIEFQQRLELDPSILTFFRHIILLDNQLTVKAAYPNLIIGEFSLSPEEEKDLIKALRDQSFLVKSNTSWDNSNNAYLTFMNIIVDSSDQPLGILVGKTDFDINPNFRSALQSLGFINENGRRSYIIGDGNQILFQPESASYLDNIVIEYFHKQNLYEEMVYEGSRYLVFSNSVINGDWSIILVDNAMQMQELALRISIPITIFLCVFFVILLFLIKHNLNKISTPINSISQITKCYKMYELEKSSIDNKGHLYNRVDEIGQIWKNIENMKHIIINQQEEIDSYPVVNWKAVGNFDVHEGIRPILQAIINKGADSVRLIINKNVLNHALPIFYSSAERNIQKENIFGDSEHQETIIDTYGLGKFNDQYSYLDNQLFETLQKQDILIIPNLTRIKSINIPKGFPSPKSIIGLSIRSNDLFSGILWIAHDHPYNFNDNDIRYYKSLVVQLSQLFVIIYLYNSARIGKLRIDEVLSSAPDPILVFDEKLRLLSANKVSTNVPGLIKSALPGQSLSEVISHPELLGLLSNSSLEHENASLELKMNDGRIYLASIYMVKFDRKISDGDDDKISQPSILGKVCFLRDVSEYKQLDNIKSDFINTVSHDLRSPLTLLHGYASMLQLVGKLNEQQENYVKKIITSVEEMNHLVSDLLDLGRIEAGVGLQIEKVDVLNLFDSVMGIVRPKTLQKKIDLSCQRFPEGETLYIEADSALIKQALLILVENAIKYTGINGCIELEAIIVKFENQIRDDEKERNIRLIVKDNGKGIAPLDIPHIFDKFYRSVNKEIEKKKGTGLGLAIVKSIAERHHGRVWVESQLGVGSTFVFEIPVKYEECERKN